MQSFFVCTRPEHRGMSDEEMEADNRNDKRKTKSAIKKLRFSEKSMRLLDIRRLKVFWLSVLAV